MEIKKKVDIFFFTAFQPSENLESPFWLSQKPQLVHRRRSFWSAPRIATSGKVQHRKSAIQGLPVPLCMVGVKSVKSYWLRIRNDAHAQKIGPSQRSRLLVLTKRTAASGDENVVGQDLVLVRQNVLFIRNISFFHFLQLQISNDGLDFNCFRCIFLGWLSENTGKVNLDSYGLRTMIDFSGGYSNGSELRR